MPGWGRKTYAKWPSRKPLWTWTAFFAALVFFAGTTVSQYAYSWGFAQKLYLGSYLKSGVRGATSAKARGRYELLEGVTAKGQLRFILGDEAEKKVQADGRILYRLTPEGTDHGLVGLRWYTGLSTTT